MGAINVGYMLNNAFIQAPFYVDSKALAASVAESIAVPAGADYVVLSGTADFYARWDGSAATVPGDIADGSASELNPGPRLCKGVANISIISAATPVVTASFWKGIDKV